MADTWFAVYDDATGELVSTGTVVADDATLAARGLVKRVLATNPQVRTSRWNKDKRDFGTVPLPKGRISLAEFLLRLVETERQDLFEAAQAGNAAVRKRVNAWIQTARETGIDLDDAETVTAVNALETAGILGAGRAAQVLA